MLDCEEGSFGKYKRRRGLSSGPLFRCLAWLPSLPERRFRALQLLLCNLSVITVEMFNF